MTNIERRIAKLETVTGDQAPIIVWEGSPIPGNPAKRPVITVRWAKNADEATSDPSNSDRAKQGTIE
jgi:hypothetical protein